MIEHLSGTILARDPGHVVIDAHGVGYGLEVTAAAAEALAPVGGAAALWVYTHVNEGAITLFGFATRGERRAFEILIGVSGLGPKAAVSILSTFDPRHLVEIILAKNAKALTKAPGIGLKRAEKLLLELKDKIKDLAAGLSVEPRAPGDPPPSELAIEPGLPLTPNAQNAVAALEALDTPAPLARKAIARAIEILGEDAPAEDLIREGLRHRRG